jgi:predicted amidohydrolase
VKLCLVQMHPELGNKKANLEKIQSYIDIGLKNDADLIVFGECALTGYELTGKLDYRELAEPVPGPATASIVKQLQNRQSMVLFGMAESSGGSVYNSALLVGAQGIIGVARKLYLLYLEAKSSGKIHDEKAQFQPGQRIAVFDTPFGRIGVLICLDNRHPEIGQAQAVAGCWLRLRPAASPHHPGPPTSSLDLGRALENQTCDCYVNICGDQGGTFYGGGTSVILGARGVQQRLSVGLDAAEGVLEYEITPEQVAAARGGWRTVSEIRPELIHQFWEIANRHLG